MTLDFCYDMQVSFSVPVTEHHYALMCLPKDTARQRIRTLYLTVEPEGEQDIDTDYFENQDKVTYFIDDNYVFPSNVELTFPEEKRNLIYIFLESMETTYADKENGGAYDVNYIPELTALAKTYEDFRLSFDCFGRTSSDENKEATYHIFEHN